VLGTGDDDDEEMSEDDEEMSEDDAGAEHRRQKESRDRVEAVEANNGEQRRC
jgi:hypothetical protein